MRFEKAPLVELIAELRWGPPLAVPQPFAGLSLAHANLATDFETFVGAFARNIGEAGYVLSERVLPPGPLQVPFVASHRFRRADTSDGTSLFTVGVGVFTANITPPYRTWDAFRPVVKLGVDALLKSRVGDAANQPFAVLSLRYMNAFREDLTQGQPAVEFMRRLGFGVSLPAPIEAYLDGARAIKPMLFLSLPISNNRVFNLNVGDALVNGQEAVMMDNTVIRKDAVEPTVDAVMAEFDAARAIIHDVFVKTTEPIVDLLGPLRGGEE